VRLIFKVITSGKEKVYNIANGKNTKLIDLAKKIKEIVKCEIVLKNQGKTILEPKININKIKREFNFKPRNVLLDLKDIIKKYQS